MQEREVRAGRERVLRGEGEGEPDAADRLDAEGHGDEGELQAPDDLRGGHRQGRPAGTITHSIRPIISGHIVLYDYGLGRRFDSPSPASPRPLLIFFSFSRSENLVLCIFSSLIQNPWFKLI